MQYDFELDNTSTLEIRYICRVNVDGVFYSSSGSSKKEAKRNCADHILGALFPDTYKKKVVNDVELEIKKKVDRIPKILNLASIKAKTAAQLLNELDPVLARSGRYINEVVINNEKIFSFEIDIKIKNKVIHGTGKNKKIAKNEASKMVIKELYNIDIDQILYREAAIATPPSLPISTTPVLNDNLTTQFQLQQQNN